MKLTIIRLSTPNSTELVVFSRSASLRAASTATHAPALVIVLSESVGKAVFGPGSTVDGCDHGFTTFEDDVVA